MLSRSFSIAFVLVISIVGGATSVNYMLDTQEDFGAVEVKGWTIVPGNGTPAAGPYSKARLARQGVLSLGRAEGLTFTAGNDSEGRPLQGDCSYEIAGSTPPSRFWTLYAADKSLLVLDNGDGSHPATHSQEILRRADNSIAVTFGANPAFGNWVRLKGTGAMTFLLTLYDTPLETGTRFEDIELPRIKRIACNG